MRLIVGDCVEVMAGLEPESVDAIVCDPPYGLEFMGEEWDRLQRFDARDKAAKSASMGRVNAPIGNAPTYRGTGPEQQAWHQRWAEQALRVLKPGGHLLAFGGSRTYHRMASAVEDAGFEIRDQLMWLYGSGFPKSHNLNGEHEGIGTALKPAHEPIVLARKPLIGKVAANVLEHGVGGLNIDACRIGTDDTRSPAYRMTSKGIDGGGFGSGEMDYDRDGTVAGSECGRWPANVMLDDEAAEGLDAANPDEQPARYFYTAKASSGERNAGLDHLPDAPPPFGNDVGDGLGRGISNTRQDWPRKNVHPPSFFFFFFFFFGLVEN